MMQLQGDELKRSIFKKAWGCLEALGACMSAANETLHTRVSGM